MRAWVVGLSVALCACGASINALYEGDVRFEHCMALDSRGDVSIPMRKGCWDEWVKFYIFGQTRDRVEYARRRQTELSLAENPAPEQTGTETSAIPKPSNALGPPPPTTPPEGQRSERSEAPATFQNCARGCDTEQKRCKKPCTTGSAACERTCEVQYKACVERCL